jgi:hypothetical protein
MSNSIWMPTFNYKPKRPRGVEDGYETRSILSLIIKEKNVWK